MSEMPKESLEKAKELLGWCTLSGWADTRDNVARYIADVSEKAGKAFDLLGGVDGAAEARGLLLPLILPNPEDDLLKEAREICARDAEEQGCPDVADRYRTGVSDSSMPMRCTLAALRRNR